MTPAQRIAARDLARSIAIADARKLENAAARARMLANKELGAMLLDQARRRGESEVNWPEYFRSAGVS